MKWETHRAHTALIAETAEDVKLLEKLHAALPSKAAWLYNVGYLAKHTRGPLEVTLIFYR